MNTYHASHFIHFTEQEGLSNNAVSSLVEDQKGNFWLGIDPGHLPQGTCRLILINGDGAAVKAFVKI